MKVFPFPTSYTINLKRVRLIPMNCIEGENVMLDAIRALQHEGTRSEVALNFREQGNEYAKTKSWVDAKEFYTKAIAVLNVKKEDDKWEKPTDPAQEEKALREAREACYANRALCNLELSGFSPLAWGHRRGFINGL